MVVTAVDMLSHELPDSTKEGIKSKVQVDAPAGKILPFGFLRIGGLRSFGFAVSFMCDGGYVKECAYFTSWLLAWRRVARHFVPAPL
jgi:hypothetical protein